MEKIAVIGLGYVGLPVAAAIGEKFPGTIGFDCDPNKIDQLLNGCDVNGQLTREELSKSGLTLTAVEGDLRGCNFFIVTVPTPIDSQKRPDLNPLLTATQSVGRVMQSGTVVVYESTVYTGLTEEICSPLLEKTSHLQRHRDFKLGYSPERINPGDKEHNLKSITKIVAAEDRESLQRVVAVYGQIIDAGIYEASSIRIAEAARVIENTQKDINIALMNEFSILFDRLNIPTRDVLEAAETKWNFLSFRPGLVGGHWFGVDPYYLTGKAERANYHPQIIPAVPHRAFLGEHEKQIDSVLKPGGVLIDVKWALRKERLRG